MPAALIKHTVCLALDGLLSTVTPGRGHLPLGPPRPGAAAFTRRLSRVARIVIHTSRVCYTLDRDRPEEWQVDAAMRPVILWLAANQIWYDEIFTGHGRPEAAVYVGPRELWVPSDPTHDDFVAAESDIMARLKV